MNDKIKKLQEQTNKELSKQTGKLADLTKDLQALLGENIALFASGKNLSNAEFLAEAKAIIEEHGVYAENFGEEELEALHEDRLKQFEKNNVIRKFSNDNLYNRTDFKEVDDWLQGFVVELPDELLQNYKKYQGKFSQELLNYLKANNVSKDTTKEQLEQYAKDFAYETTKDLFIKDDNGILKYVDRSGRHIRAEYWYEQELKQAWNSASTSDLISDMQAFGHHLLRTSAHYNCSKLCVHYQGRVFSILKNDENYEYFKDICMFTSTIGGTYKHWRCRHHESMYFEGDSDEGLYDEVTDMSDAEINAFYEQRQEGMYYKRCALQWNDRLDRAIASGESIYNISYYRRKVTYYNSKALEMGVNL